MHIIIMNAIRSRYIQHMNKNIYLNVTHIIRLNEANT